MSNEKDIRDFQRIRATGQKTKQFVNSAFYLDVLKPYIDERRKFLAESLIWRPNDNASAEKMGIACAFNSGKSLILQDVVEQLDIWISEGDRAGEALTKIEKMEAKKNEKI